MPSPATDTLVCFATPAEGRVLRSRLGSDQGRVGNRRVALLETGIGSVNAAIAATAFLTGEGSRRLVICGVGGAYPGSGLEVRDVVCATREIYGDLGATAPEGFLDLEVMGFALLPGNPPLFNTLELDLFPCERQGVFVTVNTCTGRASEAHALRERTGGDVESMEGAALVHVARRLGLPVGEVRGISNSVGRRDRGSWQVREAAEAAQETLWSWLEGE